MRAAHLPLMIQLHSAAAMASAMRSMACSSTLLPGRRAFTRIENASVLSAGRSQIPRKAVDSLRVPVLAHILPASGVFL